MPPEVRYLIICDDVQLDPRNLLRINVRGLIVNMRSKTAPRSPYIRPQFCVVVVLTDCQSPGELSVQLVHEQSGIVIFRTRPKPMRFAGDPQDAVGLYFRFR